MDYREMTRLAASPAEVRALAAMLLRLDGAALDGATLDGATLDGATLGDRALGLLTRLAAYDGGEKLSTRQLEVLDSLRERAVRSARAGQYRAADLVGKAWERRLDLADPDDADWLEGMRARGGGVVLSRGEWRKLLAICRDPEIGLIAPDEWVEL